MTADPPRSDVRHLTGMDQLPAGEIADLLDTAGHMHDGRVASHKRFSATLMFLQPSLRTRLGFAEAVHRLGGTAHVVSSRREIVEGSAVEDLRDALRIASGMSEVTVVRTDGVVADKIDLCRRPVVNAGDDVEHPTQALIDLFAIQRLCGPLHTLSVGLCGDLSMRAVRSLCKAMAVLPPARVRLMAPASRRGDAEALLAAIGGRVEWGSGGDWSGLDVLYLGGLPERKGGDFLDDQARATYALTGANIDRLPDRARVFSPMPVIDEISDALRKEPRVAMYEQSDMGVAVRMAVLSKYLTTR